MSARHTCNVMRNFVDKPLVEGTQAKVRRNFTCRTNLKHQFHSLFTTQKTSETNFFGINLNTFDYGIKSQYFSILHIASHCWFRAELCDTMVVHQDAKCKQEHN